MTSCCQEPACVLRDSCNNSKCIVACCHSKIVIQNIDTSKNKGTDKETKKSKWCIWCCIPFPHHEDISE